MFVYCKQKFSVKIETYIEIVNGCETAFKCVKSIFDSTVSHRSFSLEDLQDAPTE